MNLKIREEDFFTYEASPDYRLLDCGNGRKLERFSEIVLIRPEPNAEGKPAYSMEEWKEKADFEFIEKSKTSGSWRKLGKDVPEDWKVSYLYNEKEIQLTLKLTKFKHIGIFPEQALNWKYIAQKIRAFKTPEPKVLNLFAYTGGASLVAKACGADVTHVDSIRQVVSWANENQEQSRLADIRWIVEDARKYVQREVKRGNVYNGIILDPPAFGHGPKGQKWVLERDLLPLLKEVMHLLDPLESFLLLNVYAAGWNKAFLKKITEELEMDGKTVRLGDFYTSSQSQKRFFLGSVLRVEKG